MNDIEKEQKAFLIMKKLYLYAGKDWTTEQYRAIVSLSRKVWEEKYNDDQWNYVCYNKKWVDYNPYYYCFTNIFLERLKLDVD